MKRKYVKSTLYSIVGIIIIAFGVAMIVKANVGFDPWGVFFNAMKELYLAVKPSFFPVIQLGDSITIVNVFIVLLASFLVKEKIKWLSIAGGIVLGQFVNVWSAIISPIAFPQYFVVLGPVNLDLVGMIILVISIFILSLGIVVTIYYPTIQTPVDYLAYAIDKVIPAINYGVLRVMSDCIAMCVGIIIVYGVTRDFAMTRVSVGTILMFMITGLVINLVKSITDKFMLPKN